MSTTVAQLPHRHLPWQPMLVLLAVVAAVALFALLTVGPSQAPTTSGTQAVAAVAAGPPVAATQAQAPLKYARAPWAPTAGSTALAASTPAALKYARAPWASGGGGSSGR